MFPLEIWVGVAMLVSLMIYALTGGADFGVGVWDLFATGPRKERQREVIVKAIAPIWEVNHIWLAIVVALLYTAFPLAFKAAVTTLSIPLAVILVGLIVRGISFVMRAYVIQSEWAHESWRVIFDLSSVLVSLSMGACIGAACSGAIRVQYHTGLIITRGNPAWWAPFSVSVGFLILAVFAFLAAVYLLHETDDPDLQKDFRLRALLAGLGVFLLAWVSFVLAGEGAPLIRDGLWNRMWSIPFQGVTGMMATSALCALWIGWYTSARILVVCQVLLLILGWGMAQFPHLIAPDLTFESAAASQNVLQRVLIFLGVSLLFLIPAFGYIYREYKWRKVENTGDQSEEEIELMEIEE
jgi:cytochrome bd ubiquinol oxidase subunit II